MESMTEHIQDLCDELALLNSKVKQTEMELTLWRNVSRLLCNLPLSVRFVDEPKTVEKVLNLMKEPTRLEETIQYLQTAIESWYGQDILYEVDWARSMVKRFSGITQPAYEVEWQGSCFFIPVDQWSVWGPVRELLLESLLSDRHNGLLFAYPM